MAFQLEFEQWLAAPCERVFAFFADPRNLPLILPPDNDVRVLAAELVSREAGDPDLKLLLSFRPFPSLPFIRRYWTALITDFELGKRFRDVRVAGPFKAWEHWHEFEAAPRDGRDGTLVRDRVRYEIGMGILDGLVNALFVRRTFKKMFAYRHRASEELLVKQDAA